ncbi:MAG: succinate dehydrogenase, hydrophobic membrane anchor protein [Rickettsia endosymbiont of Bryobia graminum]|nr:succinate dehydrogenase, hydrophobic membrane anchor protein [Rickettsia endosymbiont of Bryobia graminum]
MMNSLRTDLAKAKGVGSAKSGSSHWLQQRVTAIILAICSIWLIFLIGSFLKKDLADIIIESRKTYNIIPLIILIITSFYHAMLGIRVVIEDYVHCNKLRIGLIISLQIFCIITIVSFIIAFLSTIGI